MPANWTQIAELQAADLATLRDKGATYGDSWRRRGGVDSFMMLARCWDRLEHYVQRHGNNVLEALRVPGPEADAVLDSLGDLRRYLLLVEDYVLTLRTEGPALPGGPGWDDPVYPGGPTFVQMQHARWKAEHAVEKPLWADREAEVAPLENQLPGELEGQVPE